MIGTYLNGVATRKVPSRISRTIPPPEKSPDGELDIPDASQYWGDAEHPGMPGDFLERAELEGWIQTWWEEGSWVDDSDYYADNFAMQVGTGEAGGVWIPTWMGRTGIMANMQEFSYDVYNYDSGQPWKWIQVQLTWQPMDPVVGADIDYIEVEWFPGPGGEWGFIGNLEGLLENSQQPDGYWHTKFYWEFQPNPEVETVGFFFTGPIALDQVVIDTYCVPEPATIALLGLGGLALIRRKRR